MSAENNEAVIATTYSDQEIEKVKEWVEDLTNKEHRNLFVFAESIINGKHTVILTPDGSKKGWNTADECEILRDDFIQFLDTFEFEDGSSPFSYVEVGYGEFGQKLLRGNCKNLYNDKDYAV